LAWGLGGGCAYGEGKARLRRRDGLGGGGNDEGVDGEGAGRVDRGELWAGGGCGEKVRFAGGGLGGHFREARGHGAVVGAVAAAAGGQAGVVAIRAQQGKRAQPEEQSEK